MNPVSRFGARYLSPLIEEAGFGLWLAGRTALLTPHLLKRFRSVLDQMYHTGVRTTHVVVFVAFFVGMITSMQVGIELARFGQQESIGLLVAVTMAREMGPLMTCIILAASVASGMAAELGTMKVQDELTALEVLSIDATSYLVLPRVVALTLMAPILTALADFVGIVGGGVMAVTQLGLDYSGYVHNSMQALERQGSILPIPADIYAGLLKATVFGFTIAVVGCASGMQARNGASGVGQTTRTAVRNSIILIIVLNLVLGKLLHH